MSLTNEDRELIIRKELERANETFEDAGMDKARLFIDAIEAYISK